METKKWYQSLTIQGASLLGLLTILPDIIAKIDQATAFNLSTNPIVMKVLSFSALIVVIYGRITATKAIK